MKRNTLLILLLSLVTFYANATVNKLADTKMESQPLLFIENKGQIADMEGNARPDILFETHSKGVKLFFNKNGISYQFQKTEYPEGYSLTDKKHKIEIEKNIKTSTYRMDMELMGANPNPTILKEGKTDYVENYYLGHCPNGVLNVASYTKVTYKNIYPNIDWVVYTKGQEMKYDFVVHSGGNTDLIQVRYKDAEDLKINEDGSLLIASRLGKVIDQKPISFQKKNDIISNFQLNNGVVTYKIEDYDKSIDLVIDPGLIWATYYGGSGDEIGTAGTDDNEIAADGNGNIYLAGSTNSTTSMALGGFQNTFTGSSTSAFLVKFNSSGNRLWATYYGSDYTDGTSVAIDASGNVYLAGSSQSTTLAYGGFKNTYSGTYDAFLVKFNSSGSRLWATYYGGTNYELGTDVTTDATGNVFLAGWTASTSGIAAGGHLNAYAGGNADAYLVKFNSAGSRLWATYYGGSGDDNYFNVGSIITTDSIGNIFLSGETSSTTGITAGGFQNTLSGQRDAFLVKFNTNGIRLWGTYYGGSGGESANGVISDGSNVYLVGASSTSSITGISSTGFQNTVGDGYLVKFNDSGNRIWGRRYALFGNSVDLDGIGNIYLASTINSTTILNAGGYQSTYGGGLSDAALAKFDNNGNLIGATFFGGIGEDKGRSVLVDAASNIYMAGTTSSPANISSGGFQNTYGGGANGDAFLAKFGACAVFGPEITPQVITICSGNSTNLSITGGVSYNWSTGANTANINVTPTQATTYSVTVNGNGCTATSSRTVNVYSNTSANITADGIITAIDTITSGDVVQLQLNAPLNAIPNIQWTPATSISNSSIANPFAYPSTTKVYTVVYNDTNGCTQSKSITIFVKALANIGTVGITAPSPTASLLDTILVKVQLTGVNDLYGLFMKLKGNAAVSTYLDYAGFSAGTLLGTGGSVISTPPTVVNGIYDFGITKIGAVSGYSGTGIFYTLKFVTKNVTIPNNTNFCFYLDNITANNSTGAQVGLTNQGPYCYTFTDKVNVWPGDLNNSKTVTTADLLPIGYFYNYTGPTRANASLQWIAQPATLWGYGQGSQNGSAYQVFADANGDGIISNADQTAIGFNINKFHAFVGKPSNTLERSLADGNLVITATPSSIDKMQLPQNVTLDVSLNNNNGALNSFYGISFNTLFDNTVFDLSTATFDFTGSIFGNSSTDFLNIENGTDSTISIGLTRYANAAINGNGLLCKINLKTKSQIPSNKTVTSISSFVDAANTKIGDPLIIQDTTLQMAVNSATGLSAIASDFIVVYPNPASQKLYIKSNEQIDAIKIYDAIGQLIVELNQPKSNSIDVSMLSAGIYVAEIKTGSGIVKRSWVKE